MDRHLDSFEGMPTCSSVPSSPPLRVLVLVPQVGAAEGAAAAPLGAKHSADSDGVHLGQQRAKAVNDVWDIPVDEVSGGQIVGGGQRVVCRASQSSAGVRGTMRPGGKQM